MSGVDLQSTEKENESILESLECKIEQATYHPQPRRLLQVPEIIKLCLHVSVEPTTRDWQGPSGASLPRYMTILRPETWRVNEAIEMSSPVILVWAASTCGAFGRDVRSDA